MKSEYRVYQVSIVKRMLFELSKGRLAGQQFEVERIFSNSYLLMIAKHENVLRSKWFHFCVAIFREDDAGVKPIVMQLPGPARRQNLAGVL
jgi:hypothetical protein